MRHVMVMMCAVVVMLVTAVHAQRPTVGNNIRRFVTVDAPVVALTHTKVLDGTGAPARTNQTLIIRDGRIVAMGPTASTAVPEGATVIDLTGKTVMPGMAMVHEHLYYPTGPGVYGQLGESFVQLYLAGGVTSMRTGGNVHGTMDINMKRLVEAGNKAGPWIDATAPYLNGTNNFQQMRALTGPDDARRQVNYWADEGATSFKAYMNISRDELAAAIDEAHKRGIKVTGHLCSITYEPSRVCRRANSLRGFAHGKTEQVFNGGTRAGGSDGAGARARARVAVGRDQVYRRKDWLHGGNPAQLGAPGGA